MALGILANALINSNKETHMAAAASTKTPAKKTTKKAAPAVKAEHSVKIVATGRHRDRYGSNSAQKIEFSKDGNIVEILETNGGKLLITLENLKKVMAELDKKVTVA
jgi:hypothetical protein